MITEEDKRNKLLNTIDALIRLEQLMSEFGKDKNTKEKYIALIEYARSEIKSNACDLIEIAYPEVLKKEEED